MNYPGFLKRLTAVGLYTFLPTHPFFYYFDSSNMRHMPLTTATYETAVRQITRDGNAMLKIWILVAEGTIDDTLLKRRAMGCRVRNFCQRCIVKVPEQPDVLFCEGCTEARNVEASQESDARMGAADWG